MASLTNGWKLFSAAALTAAMLFTAVPAKAEAIPDGGTFTVTWAQNPVSLNPGLSSGISSGIPGAQLFASPLQYDDQWNPHPYLAEKWEMAPDGLSLTLHLVKGAKFHDGTPITSEDVAFSIMAIKANHPFKAMYAPVSGVDTPDPYTSAAGRSSSWNGSPATTSCSRRTRTFSLRASRTSTASSSRSFPI